MTLALRRKSGSTKKSVVAQYVQKVFLSSQGFPIFLTFTVLAILFVLFRMKGVEQNYKITSISKDIEEVVLEGKELKAKKARMLSVKKLRSLAQKYDLAQPKESQIIVIPK